MIRYAFARLWPPAVTHPVMFACLLVAIIWTPATAHARCSIAIDSREAGALADKVWRNESGGNFDKILWWNRGEAFASVGIGHFIWYPTGVDGPFHESFPDLLDYLSSRSVPMPEWLAPGSARDCPWATREDFFDRRNDPEATQLRRLLTDTMALQAAFMLARLESALDLIVDAVPAQQASVIESRFCALLATPVGRYAIVDYVNFKGEGVKVEERYDGQGWGLKQVLQSMEGELPAKEDFAAAAQRVLERRVRNAPAERREERWLPGWLSRVDSYRQ